MRDLHCPHCHNSWSIVTNYKKHIYKFRKEIYFISLRKRFLIELKNFYVEAEKVTTERELIDLIKKQKVVTLAINLKFDRGIKTFYDMYENGHNVTETSLLTVGDVTSKITIDTYKDFMGGISKNISAYLEIEDDVLYSYTKDIIHFFEIDTVLANKITITKKLKK